MKTCSHGVAVIDKCQRCLELVTADGLDASTHVLSQEVEQEMRDARKAFEAAVARLHEAHKAAGTEVRWTTSPQGQTEVLPIEWRAKPRQEDVKVRQVHHGWVVTDSIGEHVCTEWDEAVELLALECGWDLVPGDRLRVVLERAGGKQ